MPWLDTDADLRARPNRVIVAGASGSGKSTLARAIARTLAIEYFEIDALYHGPGWRPNLDFVETVTARTAAPAWVTEWQYGSVKPLLADRADLLVWLDLPRHRVIASVTRRTLRRSVRRIELWNGNREPPLRTILRDRDHIVRWAWRTHPQVAPQVNACVQTRPHLTAVRLRGRAQIEAWLNGPLRRVTDTT